MNFVRKAVIRYRAERILARLLITRPPVDSQLVAEALGYRVLFVEFEAGDMDDVVGFGDPADNTIYVSKSSSPREMMKTIASELGMALLHPALWKDSERYRVRRRDGARSREELEAEWFASCLLLPRRWIVDLQRHAAMSQLETVFVADRRDIMRSLARHATK